MVRDVCHLNLVSFAQPPMLFSLKTLVGLTFSNAQKHFLKNRLPKNSPVVEKLVQHVKTSLLETVI